MCGLIISSPTYGITIFIVPQTDNPTTQIDGLTNYSEYQNGRIYL